MGPVDAMSLDAYEPDWRGSIHLVAQSSRPNFGSAIRRRLAEDMDEEAHLCSEREPDRAESATSRLSAAEIGIAQPYFLQLVSLAQVGNQASLLAEADRIEQDNCNERPRAALDLARCNLLGIGNRSEDSATENRST